MKASEWRKGLPADLVSAQSAILSAAVEHDMLLPIEWVGIPVGAHDADAVLYVPAEPLRIGEPDDFVYVNVTCETMQQLCDALGLQMMTPKMFDLMYEAQEVALEPCTYSPSNGGISCVDPASGKTVYVSMSSVTAMFAATARVRSAKGEQSGLCPNVGKGWDLIVRNAQNRFGETHPQGGFRVANYGWFSKRAPYPGVSGGHKLWQPNSTAHNEKHTDYSQVAWACHPIMRFAGAGRPTADVMMDAKYSRLITHDGPLTLARHPRIPVYIPPSGMQCIAPPIDNIRIIGEAPTAPEAPSLPFVQARNYTKTGVRKIDLIVIHTMEAPEKPGTAMGVAKWFAGPNAPRASAHYCIDNGQIVQCVNDLDVAWGAPGTNHNGIHLEHAGYAAQTDPQWRDAYSLAMLDRSAKLTAALCAKYGLPPVFVDHEGLLEGDQGITTHREITQASIQAQREARKDSPFFNKNGPTPINNHTDPGVCFPMRAYLDLVKRYMTAA